MYARFLLTVDMELEFECPAKSHPYDLMSRTEGGSDFKTLKNNNFRIHVKIDLGFTYKVIGFF